MAELQSLLAVALSALWKILVVIAILANLKNLPLIWHVRLLRGFRHVLRSNRSNAGPTPAQLFQPLITSSHGPLMELDYNLHSECTLQIEDAFDGWLIQPLRIEQYLLFRP